MQTLNYLKFAPFRSKRDHRRAWKRASRPFSRQPRKAAKLWQRRRARLLSRDRPSFLRRSFRSAERTFIVKPISALGVRGISDAFRLILLALQQLKSPPVVIAFLAHILFNGFYNNQNIPFTINTTSSEQCGRVNLPWYFSVLQQNLTHERHKKHFFHILNGFWYT